MTLLPLSQTCMTPSRDVVWVTEMRRRLGAASVPIKNRLCRVGDKRDWASGTILISAPLVPPRYNCLCRPRIWGPLRVAKQRLSVGPSEVHEFRPRC